LRATGEGGAEQQKWISGSRIQRFALGEDAQPRPLIRVLRFICYGHFIHLLSPAKKRHMIGSRTHAPAAFQSTRKPF
jgi:hypothetical protein